MRARRLALTLAVALPLALALAACSGSAATPEAASSPAPTATATPEATSTPAPTATATPEATSTLTPEQACANGVAVADPAHLGLVADCEALLRARDALRGDASLDWGGGLAVADWEGVAVSGDPPRVTGLDLRDKGLTGSIPRELRRLRLGEVRLGGNALSGCVPSAFEDASGDAAGLGLPWCLRYDRLDATGEASEAGEWAILGGNGEVLATWEQLRSEAATLRVHQTDAGGNSWASEFGAVAEGSLIEWREADDCWVRYRVTGAPVAPSGGPGRWEFPVEWMTYAATGAGCIGEVGSDTVLSADEAAPDSVRTTPSPVRHGPYLLVPRGWKGAIEQPAAVTVEMPPALGDSGASGSADKTGSQGATLPLYPSGLWPSDDAAEVHLHPLWRNPVLPAGWAIWQAQTARYGYEAEYANNRGYGAVEIRVRWLTETPYKWTVMSSRVRELRIIDGRQAMVVYDDDGWSVPGNTKVSIYDRTSGIEYVVLGYDPQLQANNIEATIAIAVSLLPPDSAP